LLKKTFGCKPLMIQEMFYTKQPFKNREHSVYEKSTGTQSANNTAAIAVA
jgi:hypothetical protein